MMKTPGIATPAGISTPIAALLLVAAVWATFAPSLRNGFVWDDDRYITGNAALRAPDALVKIWTDRQALPSPYPLSVSLFYFEFLAFDLKAPGYHAVSLAMHSVAVLLLYFLLLRLRVRGAWLASLLFAIHPVQVETVAWIAEQKNIFSTILGLLFLHAWLRHQRQGDGLAYGFAVVFFILSMLAKTVTQTFVGTAFLVWLLDRHRSELAAAVRSWKGFAIRVAPLLVIAAVFALATIFWERTETGATTDAVQIPPGGRLRMAARVPWFYLLKGLCPMDLMAIYPRWDLSRTGGLEITFIALTLIFAAWTAWNAVARANPVALAAAHFLGSLVPVMGFFNFSTMIHSFAADHYQYVAAVGWMLPLAWAMDACAERIPVGWKWGKIICLVVVVGATATISCGEAAHYRDLESLFRRCLAKNPAAWNAHYNVAHALNGADRTAEALVEYQECLKLKPNFPAALNGIGVIQMKAGKYEEAMPWFRKAREQNPDFPDAKYNLVSSLVLVAEAALQTPNYSPAEPLLLEALGLNPNDVDALLYFGQLRLRQGRAAEAIAPLDRAAQLAPGDADVANTLRAARGPVR